MQNVDVLPDGTRALAPRAPGGRASARLRILLLVEGGSFLAASLVHRGVLVAGYEHDRAAVAETVIGAVLLAGLAASAVRPPWTRAAGIAAQSFALAGTLVGITMVAIGVGPRTAPDVVYHAAILTLLAAGLAWTVRSGRDRHATQR